MIEVRIMVELTEQEHERLCEVARQRYSLAMADGWPASTQVPNLLRDLMADALERLIGTVPPGHAGSMRL